MSSKSSMLHVVKITYFKPHNTARLMFTRFNRRSVVALTRIVLMVFGILGLLSLPGMAQISTFPYFEDFEHGGALPPDWLNATGDNFDWTVDSGGTPSTGTGPSVDHTSGTSTGYYVYTEASSPNYPSKTAQLVTPQFDLSTLSAPMLEFWYHMYGSSMGTLHLDVHVNGSWQNDIITPLSGDAGDSWHLQEVDLSAYTEVVQIRFRGITGMSYISDMAIDDVIIYQEALMVDAVLPDRHAVNVPANTDITITCNASVDAATVTHDTLRVNGAITGPHIGVFTVVDNTITFTPDADFAVGETVTVTLTPAITGTDVLPLNPPVTWQFVIAGGGYGSFYGTDISADAEYTLSIAVGDVDNDSDIDVVAGNVGEPNTLYLNNGTSDPFSEVSGQDLANGTAIVALGDVNGDGWLDLVGANCNMTNWLYLNTGATQPFTTSVSTMAEAKCVNSVVLGDVDGDGDLDAVTGDDYEENHLYLNNGTADPFGGVSGIPISTDVDETQAVALSDVDLDGDLDLVVGNNGVNRLYLNNGTANPFYEVTGTEITSDTQDTWSVALGDLNGDGYPDLVTGNMNQRNRLYLNTGAIPPFTIGTDITTEAHNTRSVSLGDINGDGYLDVIESVMNAPNRVYLHNGSAAPFDGIAGKDMTPDSAATLQTIPADIDGDGDLDVVTANYSGQINRLYINEAEPEISGYIRTAGGTGIAGVTFAGLPALANAPVTDDAGYYHAKDMALYHWSGTIAPQRTGFSFAPASRTYANFTDSQTEQNYTGTCSAVPEPVILSEPSGTIQIERPTYTWNAIECAERYKLLVMSDSSTTVFESWYNADEVCANGTCSVALEDRLTNGDYTWQVLTWNTNGDGTWSDKTAFTMSVVLSFVEMQYGSLTGLEDTTSTAISPDGKHLYTTSPADGAIGIFRRDAMTGMVEFVEVLQNGVNGMTDLLRGINSIVVSPDGAHVYATSSNTVVVFSRNTETGTLNVVEVLQDGVGGVDGLRGACSIAVSSDGNNIYVAGSSDDAVAVFSRNPTTGALTFVEVHKGTFNAMDGLSWIKSVIVSPDGAYVYTIAAYNSDNSMAIFSRNPTTGALTRVGTHTNGLNGNDLGRLTAIAISPDGAHIYVTGFNGLVAFSRDIVSGALTFVEVYINGVNGVNGLGYATSVIVSFDGAHVYTTAHNSRVLTLFDRNAVTGALALIEKYSDNFNGIDGLGGAFSIAISPDDTHLYVTGKIDQAMAAFSRNTTSGLLSFIEVLHDGEGNPNGADGLDRVCSVTVSSDGKHVYTVSLSDNAIAVFSRDTTTGSLTFVEVLKDGVNGVDGLHGARSVTVSSDGKHVYTVGSSDNAIAVFSRDTTTGSLTFVEVHKDGVNGVDGLYGARSVTVSSDGKHVYTVGFSDNAIAVFSRDTTTGSLTFVEVHKDGVNGVDGLHGAHSVTVSSDGKHVYTVGYNDNAIAVFSRDTTTGSLTFVEVQKEGVNGVEGMRYPCGIALSSDGSHLYVSGDLGIMTIFRRNLITGALTFVETQEASGSATDSNSSVAISSDDVYVYATGYHDHAVAVFSRDAAMGNLSFLEAQEDGMNGVNGLYGANFVTVSPDGAHVYVTAVYDDAVAVFKNNNAAPEINLKQGMTDIASGGSYDFGAVSVNSDSTITFIVENISPGDLVLLGNPKVEISGANSADFAITQQPAFIVEPGDSTTFHIQFAPGALGLRTATISITNNDGDENPYRVKLQGTGNSMTPIGISLNNNSVAENEPAGTTVGTLTTTDSNSDTHTYTLLTNGCSATYVDSALFRIGGTNSDELQTAAAFNYETRNSYEICVQADDGNGGTYAETFTITVTNVVEPLIVSIAPASMSERNGSATGTVSRAGGDLSVALIVTLTSNNTREATVPSSVEIPADQSSVTFAIAAVDDAVVDGPQTVTITASATDYADGTDTVEVTDDDTETFNYLLWTK